MDRLLILFLPTVLASGYYEYKGFDSCGLGGWTCRSTPNGYEVIYRCHSLDRDARLWMWTARIPGSATTLAIENCNHVEVHSDCTMGYRGYNMRTFRATNIQQLEFLKPLPPYVQLHDNDQVAHMPPEVIFENIGRVITFPGAFDKAGRRCRTKQQHLSMFTARNVTFENFLQNQFSEQTLETFSLQKVKFLNSDERTTFSVTANVSVSETNFENVTATGTLSFKGPQVTLQNNQFGKMTEGALTVKCYNFEFEGNTIAHADRGSFDVLAQNVSIVSNTILKLEGGAFAKIKPGSGQSHGFEAAKKAIYVFNENAIHDLGILALHPDLEAYNNTCSSLTIQNNQLPCSCPQFNWAVATLPFHFFYYQLSAYENNNTCYQFKLCNLAHALQFKDNCSDFHTCDSQAMQDDTISSTIQPTTKNALLTEIFTTKTPMTVATTAAPAINDKVVLPESYKTFNVLIIIVACVLVLSVAAILGVSLYCYNKNKKVSEALGPVYQNQCRSEYDEQILIDEP